MWPLHKVDMLLYPSYISLTHAQFIHHVVCAYEVRQLSPNYLKLYLTHIDL